ncbi:hypothetical protein Tco_0125794, partial [Tanacetum coccineum]
LLIVVGGKQLTSECKGFMWKLHGETFVADMMIFPFKRRKETRKGVGTHGWCRVLDVECISEHWFAADEHGKWKEKGRKRARIGSTGRSVY